MFPRVSPQTHRRSRRGVVAPLILLLATTTAATQQQDSATAARVRAARMRAAAGRLDTAAARIRAKTQTPPAQTTDGTQVPTITMPRLIGLDTLGAIRVLRSRKMLRYVILPPAPGLIARDEIAAQDPAPDAPYTYPSPVRLTLAGRQPPPDSVTVPSVIGLSRNDAELKLERLRLGVDAGEEPVMSLDSVGRVIRQKPSPGERLLPGSRVAISLGRDARIAMPLVTGFKLDVARRMLRDSGLLATPIERRVKGVGVPVDSVVDQSPEPGTLIASDVVAVLDLGRAAAEVPPTIAVPPLLGLDSASAIRTLAAVGFPNYVVQRGGGAAEDSVGAQSPAAGALVPPQTSIMLTMRARVDAGVPPPRPPHLTIPFVALLLIAGVVAGYAARTIWPPPTITPSARIQAGVAELSGLAGSLVEVSVSFRSHVEHEPSELELASAPPS